MYFPLKYSFWSLLEIQLKPYHAYLSNKDFFLPLPDFIYFPYQFLFETMKFVAKIYSLSTVNHKTTTKNIFRRQILKLGDLLLLHIRHQHLKNKQTLHKHWQELA